MKLRNLRLTLTYFEGILEQFILPSLQEYTVAIAANSVGQQTSNNCFLVRRYNHYDTVPYVSVSIQTMTMTNIIGSLDATICNRINCCTFISTQQNATLNKLYSLIINRPIHPISLDGNTTIYFFSRVPFFIDLCSYLKEHSEHSIWRIYYIFRLIFCVVFMGAKSHIKQDEPYQG